VYLFRTNSPLAFWYEIPTINEHAFQPGSTAYFMTFDGKAEYGGPFDSAGIPLLDYRGEIGLRYNPIAIAQFGLAIHNRYQRTADTADRSGYLRVADWLVTNLHANDKNLQVWCHDFDWPYRQTLMAPWYSGLAQGSGLSLLVRAAADTGDAKYGSAAHAVYESFNRSINDGGVVHRDEDGNVWIEEYLVDPPSHILNGFIWATWGIYDYARWSGAREASALFDAFAHTVAANLEKYDTGFWSMYELPCGGRRMLASPYYHRLHVVQLQVMYRLTGLNVFNAVSERWASYAANRLNRTRAIAEKTWFKLRYY
jgi:hypothetical protein